MYYLRLSIQGKASLSYYFLFCHRMLMVYWTWGYLHQSLRKDRAMMNLTPFLLLCVPRKVLSRLSLQIIWVAAPKHFETSFTKQVRDAHGMVWDQHCREDTYITRGQKSTSFLATTQQIFLQEETSNCCLQGPWFHLSSGKIPPMPELLQ